jgi:hypothetical protein
MLGLALVFGLAGQAQAEVPLSDNAQLIQRCLYAAADVHRVPPAVLVVLLNVEGGTLGHVSANTNATVDIGPMQVNQIWIPQIAAHWHASPAATFTALRDSFCANVEAGAWILRQGLDEAHGDFWQGVGYYHSHDPQHKATYLQSVLKQVLRLRAASQRPPQASRTAAVTSNQIALLQPGAR